MGLMASPCTLDTPHVGTLKEMTAFFTESLFSLDTRLSEPKGILPFDIHSTGKFGVNPQKVLA